MGPPSYMRSVVDRNVVMRRMTVQKSRRRTYRRVPCVWPEPSICLHVRADSLRVTALGSCVMCQPFLYQHRGLNGMSWEGHIRHVFHVLWTNSWNRALLQKLTVTQLHKIPLILYNPQFPCPVRKNLSLDLILSQINQATSHTLFFSHPLLLSFLICPTNAHNSYKIVKLLKSFKIIIVAPTCFGLHKPSSGSSQPVLRQVTMLIWVIYIVIWSYRYWGCILCSVSNNVTIL